MLQRFRFARTSIAVTGLVLVGLTLAACGGGGTAPKSSGATHEATKFDSKLAAEGKTIANSNVCTVCHTVDGRAGVGPTWKGMYGHPVQLTDGSTVNADDAYIKESIVTPNATVVKGFAPGAMPATFGQSLTEKQILAVIEYMKSLQ